MKKSTHARLLWPVLIALLAALLACGPLTTGSAATSAPTKPPPATAKPQQAATPAGEVEAADTPQASTGTAADTFAYRGVDLKQHDRYAATYSFVMEGTTEDGTPTYASEEGEVYSRTDPLLFYLNTHLIVDSTAGMEPGEREESQVAIYGTDTQTCIGDPTAGEFGCNPLEEGDPGAAEFGQGVVPFGEYIDVDASQPPELMRVGEEDVSGVPTVHYHADSAQLTEDATASIDVWYVPAEDYIRRLELAGEGTVSIYGTGSFEAVFEIQSVNQPLEVTPPPGIED